ncbi:uncharacterized protein LOC112576466 [Pomacea canaliculata]|uniref:uncharacterized protein LOC112576466 n=1 Tax=Pomacea canaliculata TaxID=400727 RepID=UPI000D734A25|nr:uncharacterized protein LOC112576466 [Pomacea canaliculata]
MPSNYYSSIPLPNFFCIGWSDRRVPVELMCSSVSERLDWECRRFLLRTRASQGRSVPPHVRPDGQAVFLLKQAIVQTATYRKKGVLNIVECDDVWHSVYMEMNELDTNVTSGMESQ